MGNKKFSISDLDQILSDAINMNEINKIHNELVKEEDDDQLVSDNSVSPQIANMVNQRDGLTVDYSRVYKQLEKLIQNGNVALEIIAAIDPDTSNGQIGTTTASLMNAIKNCIAQFTKIHLLHIKFQQAIDMENIRHQHKMEQLEKREDIINARNKANNSNTININPVSSPTNTNNTMVPYNTENVIEYIQFIKQQKQGKNVI